jgi:hypothetical protein
MPSIETHAFLNGSWIGGVPPLNPPMAHPTLAFHHSLDKRCRIWRAAAAARQCRARSNSATRRINKAPGACRGLRKEINADVLRYYPDTHPAIPGPSRTTWTWNGAGFSWRTAMNLRSAFRTSHSGGVNRPSARYRCGSFTSKKARGAEMQPPCAPFPSPGIPHAEEDTDHRYSSAVCSICLSPSI